jgi:hypothetical protein
MMLNWSVVLTLEELDLYHAIKDTGYGEIFGIEIPISGDYRFSQDVSENFRDLLTLIRSGIHTISVLTLHQGEPVLVELDEKIGDFRCRKKIKIPTVKTEGC